jgi:hypothetical protein
VDSNWGQVFLVSWFVKDLTPGVAARVDPARPAGVCRRKLHTEPSERTHVLVVHILRPRIVRELLAAVAPVVEDQWVKVDLSATPVAKDQPGRPPLRLPLVATESQRCESGAGALAVRLRDSNVKVVVPSTLLAEQCIDAPAPVEPNRGPRPVERIENLDDIVSRHDGSARMTR